MSFFRKYLGEEVGARGDKPLIAPRTLTMNDFFYRVCDAGATDRVHLLLELYECYKALYPKAEALDDFIFWGDVLLADFDDVDKYLVNPAHLFANVADFKSIQDTYSYLSEGQMDAIRRFLEHFRTSGELTVDLKREDGRDYKVRFLQIWNILYSLYSDFGARLKEKGMSYEGQVYRELAERLSDEAVVDILSGHFDGVTKYVFVGLNALNGCEKRLLSKMRDAGLAEFCWDFSSAEIKDPNNKSAFFLRDNVAEYPQAFRIDPEGLPKTEFHALSVPSATGQAKQLASILADCGSTGIDTAVILPDESLLIPVLNSIPESYRELNVTMGYPMGGSSLWSLMNDISALQMHLRFKDGDCFFYHKQVWSIFSNSVFKSVLSPEGLKTVTNVKKGVKYYIPQEELKGDPVLELIFRPAMTDASKADADAIKLIQRYQKDLLSGIAPLLKDKGNMELEMDFAKDYWLAVSRLESCHLEILPVTYFRLLGQLLGTSSVPFQGEPLKGLQIMGPLETRALDFDNVILLNCNEGIFPRRSVSSSFIPPELRKGFGLPTYEYQDAVWAYYFYRLIQRASKVWMLFDSRTEGVRGGEESRYIKQLELHFGKDVRHSVASAPIGHTPDEKEIVKTEKHIKTLHEGHLSASSLQNYLSCPAKFYYSSVCGLKEDDEVSESLDAGALGDVFHKTMQELYKDRESISTAYLDALLKDRAGIKARVGKQIMNRLHSFEVAGRNIIFQDVVSSYVLKALQRDRELLDSYGVGEFRVLGLEKMVKKDIYGYEFIGFIDRLDSFIPSEIRVVDYKTGKVTDNDFLIDDDNAESVVEALFGDDNNKRPKIALQLYLYDRFIEDFPEVKGREIVNSIYQTGRLFVNEVEKVALSPRFCELCSAKLEETLDEISDTGRPWSRTEDVKTCEYCDFKMICGR